MRRRVERGELEEPNERVDRGLRVNKLVVQCLVWKRDYRPGVEHGNTSVGIGQCHVANISHLLVAGGGL